MADSTDHPIADAAPWQRLRQFTDARIALGAAGISQPTDAQLAFQLAHARARDAVHLPLDTDVLMPALPAAWPHICPPFLLHSAAANRNVYLQRPDLGRRLDPASRAVLADIDDDKRRCDLAIVVADGLSSHAIAQNAAPFLAALRLELAAETWTLAPVTIVRQGRVAVGDEVGELLGSENRRGADRRTARSERARQHGHLPDLGATRWPDRRASQLHLERQTGGVGLCPGCRQAALSARAGATAAVERCCIEG